MIGKEEKVQTIENTLDLLQLELFNNINIAELEAKIKYRMSLLKIYKEKDYFIYLNSCSSEIDLLKNQYLPIPMFRECPD